MEFQEAMERARAAAYEPSAAVDWDLVEYAGAGVGEDGEAGIVASYLDHHLPRWYRALTLEGAAPWADLEARVLAQPVLPIPTAERNEADSMRSACAVWRETLGALDTQDEEARWRGWLCAWVLGFDSVEELTCWLTLQVQQRLPTARRHEHRYFHNSVVTADGCNGWIIIARETSYNRSPKLFNVINSIPFSWWGDNQPLSVDGFSDLPDPKIIAQAAQQCLIRIPDRIVARFALRRWQTSLGFEV